MVLSIGSWTGTRDPGQRNVRKMPNRSMRGSLAPAMCDQWAELEECIHLQKPNENERVDLKTMKERMKEKQEQRNVERRWEAAHWRISHLKWSVIPSWCVVNWNELWTCAAICDRFPTREKRAIHSILNGVNMLQAFNIQAVWWTWASLRNVIGSEVASTPARASGSLLTSVTWPISRGFQHSRLLKNRQMLHSKKASNANLRLVNCFDICFVSVCHLNGCVT